MTIFVFVSGVILGAVCGLLGGFFFITWDGLWNDYENEREYQRVDDS